MGIVRDLTGMRFGKLVCKTRVGSNRNRSFIWLCVCDCGAITEVIAPSLLTGNTKSCGCFQKETAAETCRSRVTHGFAAKGLTNSGLYKSWAHMKERCLNPGSADYENYGGRGIKICQKWLTFDGFRTDMEQSYRDGLSIERINNDGNYEPDNCRWATSKEQNNNKRNNRLVTYNGETMTVAQWSRRTGIAYNTIMSRIYNGWEPSRAVTVKPGSVKPGPKTE